MIKTIQLESILREEELDSDNEIENVDGTDEIVLNISDIKIVADDNDDCSPHCPYLRFLKDSEFGYCKLFGERLIVSDDTKYYDRAKKCLKYAKNNKE